jgi:hypothetical protein
MDSEQMPNVQPAQAGQVESAQPAVKPTPAYYKEPNNGGLVKTILVIVLSLVSVTFIGLFVWMNMQYNSLNDNVNAEIEAAVTEAVTEQALADAEEAKKETREFAGPADYGSLSFVYPKLWSVYVEKDASNGGDFVAYLNPIEIEPVSENTIYALRVTIRDKDFETVAAEYQRAMDRKDANLSMTTVTVGGVTANRYVGTIPNSSSNGIVVIFKIRDKTAVLRTDSVNYQSDFDKILSTVQFNA